MYDKYKNTRIEWFNSIPSHWSVIPLKRMLMGLQDGTHGTYQNADSEHFLLSAKNIMEDGIHIGIGDRTISEEDYKEIIANGFPQKGDILLCCVGTIGRCCIFEEEEPIAFQRSVSFLRTNDRNHNKFILYLLNSQAAKIQYELFAKTSAQSGLYMGDLCKLLFPCPPKAEQIAIAAYLDEKCEDINKSIDGEKKRIELLNELKQSIITNAITKGLNPDAQMKDSYVEWIGKTPNHWEVCKLKNYCSLKARIGWKGLRSDEFEEDSYAYLVTGQDFKMADINWSACYQIDKERYEEDPYIQLSNGDLLITKDGTIGKIAKVSNLDKPACLNSGVFVLKQKTIKFDQQFLYWSLVSTILTEFNNYTSTGTTILHLYQNVFENMPLVVPPLDEQKSISKHLEQECKQIQISIEKHEKRIQLLNELKQSIITEAVTGKVKVC